MAIDYDRINWEDSLRTPLGQRNLNKMDKGIKDLANLANKTGEYTLLASSWTATGDSTYPYINELAVPNVYTSEDHPIAQVWGMGDIETEDELTGISYISKVIVNVTGIKVYALDIPSVNLKLILKE